ncbi:OmpA family protein [Brumimicrobium oceani]|uniref:OmpA-like domain-containing protein n=1 Tax=Brumimicrobium oceani TaxID=2100725 RepID=A0A2U2XCU9_9FLAO|nr:OmpA family protein [Brumimicrobium oceani]PWH85624.1 hypothetical protein DIT68_08275 [Brumimicrobium oceani]
MVYKFIIFFFLLPSLLLSQEKIKQDSESGMNSNIGDCIGAITIEPNVSSNVQLTGAGGEVDDFKFFPNVLEGAEINSLWFNCETKLPGFLSITLEKADFSFNYVAFLIDQGEKCGAILNGSIPPIQNGIVTKKNMLTFLLDSVEIQSNQRLILCINSQSTALSDFTLISSFGNQITDKDIEEMKKTYDFRTDISDKAFEIKLRDAQSKLPLVAKVIVSGTKKNNALYMASDFVVPNVDNLRMNLKIDATGYFFEDREVHLRSLKGDELVIFMEPIQTNQSIELEGLEFVSQSDVLLPSAYVKLKRLKDFMANNSGVEIEVQGHVHRFGKNTWRARRLSKRRANKVKEYLVDTGIKKSRISAVGLGNTQMKHPDAKSDVEIQANRRVEIRIR